MVDRLAAAGLAERQPDPDDRRRVSLRPTAQSVDQVRTAVTPALQVLDEELAALSPAHRDALVPVLQALRRAVERTTDERRD